MFSRLWIGALLAAFLFSPAVHAAPLVYASGDTRTGGSFAPVPFGLDGNGSLKLTTDSAIAGGSQAKVEVIFTQPNLQPLGTLGQLQSATFDYFKSSSSTTPANSAPAVRLILGPGLALVWEHPYQGLGNPPTDAWQDDVNILGQLWQRGNGQNFDQIANLKTLPGWVGGFTPPGGVTLNANTPIYGVSIGFGSGITGQFTSYVDDLKLTFDVNGNTVTYNGNVVLPEPTSALAFAGLAGMAVLYRRRKAA